MSTNLEERFLAFLAALPGAESLDALLADKRFDGHRRADYLLHGRKVVVEVKSIEVDPSQKAEAELAQHRGRCDFPRFYGDVELGKILAHLPDGEQIHERIYNRATRSIEEATRSAEKQLRSTKELLALPDAVGLLVVLNQTIDILGPNATVSRLSPLLCRRGQDGQIRSPIDFAWLIFESHSIAEGPAMANLPVVLLEGERTDDFPWFSPFFASLQEGWAKFNGRALVRSGAPSLENFTITPTSKMAEVKAPVTRQEYWQDRYRRQPYLRSLSDDQVIQRGFEAMQSLRPHVMVNAPRPSFQQIEPFMVAWSDFLCEAEHRGLDLRKIPKA